MYNNYYKETIATVHYYGLYTIIIANTTLSKQSQVQYSLLPHHHRFLLISGGSGMLLDIKRDLITNNVHDIENTQC